MGSQGITPPRLVIIEGKEKGKVIPLKSGTVIIGRSKGDVLIHDPRISRSHVAIHFDDKTGQLSFTDLKSLNGTQVNGEPSIKGQLQDGDKLQMGDTTFDCQMFTEGESADRTQLAETKRASSGKKRDPSSDKRTQLKLNEENSFPPLDGPMEAEHRIESSYSQAEADSFEENTNTSAEPNLPQWKRLYLRVPARVRHLSLGVLLIFFSLAYIGRTNEPDPVELQRGINAVRKLAEAGNWEEALATAKALQKQNSEHSLPWMLLGDLYLHKDNFEASISAYQSAADLQPAQPLAHVRLLRLYLKAKLSDQVQKEMEVVDALLREGQPNKQVFIEAAELYLEHKELKQSPEKVFVLAKGLQHSIAPETTIGYKLEAQVLFEQNRPKEALDTLIAGSKIDPQDEWLLENIAFARLSLNDVAGASEAVENWLSRHPATTKGLLVMAYLKFNAKNYLGALPYAQKIVQLGAATPQAPHYSEALNLVGQIYLQQNQTNEAETFFKQSCEYGYQKSCSHPLVQGKMPASVSEETEPSSP